MVRLGGEQAGAAPALGGQPLSLLPRVAGRAPRILCLGAHADDIEIGCGGTLIELLGRHRPPRIDWVVFSGGPARRREAERSAARLLPERDARRLRLLDFPDGRFPQHYDALKDAVREIATRSHADLVFTHARDDLHQDHRLLSELTWNEFRRHLVLEYEIPKWDGDLGRPNLFVPLSRRTLERKLRHLMAVFGSQRGRDWFDPETFRGLARLRGMECRATSGYAEAFHARKLVVDAAA